MALSSIGHVRSCLHPSYVYFSLRPIGSRGPPRKDGALLCRLGGGELHQGRRSGSRRSHLRARQQPWSFEMGNQNQDDKRGTQGGDRQQGGSTQGNRTQAGGNETQDQSRQPNQGGDEAGGQRRQQSGESQRGGQQGDEGQDDRSGRNGRSDDGSTSGRTSGGKGSGPSDQDKKNR
jgi:hypothetical protein